MTDKEMIEEMASCMCSSYKSEKGCKTCPTNWCYAEECATMAFCNNYRKIPEGSVVLSKEEYGEYVELRNSEVGELVKENRELGKQCLDWMKLYHKQLTKTEQTRKETAKEILQELYCFPHEYHEKKILELAKQYEIEVEEL